MKRIDLIYWLCVDDASLIHWDAYNESKRLSLPSNSIAGGGAGLMVAEMGMPEMDRDRGCRYHFYQHLGPTGGTLMCAMVKLHALLHLKNK
jgi:hypothetical protein